MYSGHSWLASYIVVHLVGTVYSAALAAAPKKRTLVSSAVSPVGGEIGHPYLF